MAITVNRVCPYIQICQLCYSDSVIQVLNVFSCLKLCLCDPQIRDEWGNKIWICPGCNKPDDGSPMIGCDECDDWYHW